MKKIKLSIVIPVYNCEKYIEKCILSLLNKITKEVELIFVNDHTKDNAMEIVDKYSKHFSNIKILNNEQNIGLGLTRNNGIKIAKGEYISFVDSDDFVVDDYYEIVLSKIDKETDVFIFNYQDVDMKNQMFARNDYVNLRRCRVFKTNILTTPSVCCKVFKKDLFSHIKFKKGYSEDNIFWLDEFWTNKKMKIFDEVIYQYRFNTNSLTKTVDEETAMIFFDNLKQIVGNRNNLDIAKFIYHFSINRNVPKLVNEAELYFDFHFGHNEIVFCLSSLEKNKLNKKIIKLINELELKNIKYTILVSKNLNTIENEKNVLNINNIFDVAEFVFDDFIRFFFNNPKTKFLCDENFCLKWLRENFPEANYIYIDDNPNSNNLILADGQIEINSNKETLNKIRNFEKIKIEIPPEEIIKSSIDNEFEETYYSRIKLFKRIINITIKK